MRQRGESLVGAGSIAHARVRGATGSWRARRVRLIAQLLTESAVLAVLGGAIGVVLARWSLTGIARLSPLGLPRIGEIRLDGLVLGFAMAFSFATVVVFGLIPSLGASRPDLAAVLRAGGEGRRTGARRRILHLNARGVLVAGRWGSRWYCWLARPCS